MVLLLVQEHEKFWKKGPDDTYVCIEAKASNCFMPKKTITRGASQRDRP